MIRKKVYFDFLVFMMMITTFLPLVSNNLPPFIGSFHLYGPLFILSIVIFNIKVIFHKNLIITLIIGLLILLIFPMSIWNYMDEWNTNNQRTEFYFLITALVTFYYYQSRNDFQSYAKIVQFTLIFIGITSIMSIYSSFIDPEYARRIMANELTGDEKVFYSKLGGGSYGLAAALMALLPISIYYYKKNALLNLPKIIIVLFVVLILTGLIRMQFFGNILVGIIVLIFSFFGRKKIDRSIFLVGILGIVILLIPKDFYSDILKYSSNIFDSESSNYYKITDMSDYFMSGEEDNIVSNRAERYPELWIAFLNSPFLGTSFSEDNLYKGAGAHLYWMNRLTIFGLFGFIIFIQIFIRNIKYFTNLIADDEFLFYYLLSIGSIIGYGFIKSIDGRETWFMLFFIIPGLYYLPLMKKSNLFASNF